MAENEEPVRAKFLKDTAELRARKFQRLRLRPDVPTVRTERLEPSAKKFTIDALSPP
jgi:hypothetical protein